MVLKTLRYVEETSDIETGEVMVFVGDRFVVTVRHGEGNPLAGVRARLEHNAEHLAYGPMAVLHAVMDSIVDNYIARRRRAPEDLEQIEQQVFSGDRDVDADQRSTASSARSWSSAGPPCRWPTPLERLLRDSATAPSTARSEVLPFFRDVPDHLLKVNDHVESYDRLLSDILGATWRRSRVQQNDDMRKISAWVAIAAVPTMIAGIYGMNFTHIPELRPASRRAHEYYYGYFVVLAVMAAVCVRSTARSSAPAGSERRWACSGGARGRAAAGATAQGSGRPRVRGLSRRPNPSAAGNRPQWADGEQRRQDQHH